MPTLGLIFTIHLKLYKISMQAHFYIRNNNSMGNEQFHLFTILITPSPILLQNPIYCLKHFSPLYHCTFIHLQHHFGVVLVTLVKEPSSPHMSPQFSSSSCLWEGSSQDLFLPYLHIRLWSGYDCFQGIGNMLSYLVIHSMRLKQFYEILTNALYEGGFEVRLGLKFLGCHSGRFMNCSLKGTLHMKYTFKYVSMTCFQGQGGL